MFFYSFGGRAAAAMWGYSPAELAGAPPPVAAAPVGPSASCGVFWTQVTAAAKRCVHVRHDGEVVISVGTCGSGPTLSCANRL